ncbi:hypothetical protein JB92DRAFT_3128296 [Gautieria morchelliformis]|nr:hypothetical protein JB92DRAFT_3128296 [Gautieria morchelliformis]
MSSFDGSTKLDTSSRYLPPPRPSFPGGLPANFFYTPPNPERVTPNIEGGRTAGDTLDRQRSDNGFSAFSGRRPFSQPLGQGNSLGLLIGPQTFTDAGRSYAFHQGPQFVPQQGQVAFGRLLNEGAGESKKCASLPNSPSRAFAYPSQRLPHPTPASAAHNDPCTHSYLPLLAGP